MTNTGDGLSDHELAEGLQVAGFELLQARYGNALIPVQAAWAVTTCQPGEGGRRDIIVGLDDPNLVTKLNASWGEAAREVDLLDLDGRFLLSVITGDSGLSEPHWALVCQRSNEPDIAGVGASLGIFGFRSGYIEFAASSLDGRAVVRGTLWRSSAGLLCLNSAPSSPRLRDYIRNLVERGTLSGQQSLLAQEWLATGCGS